MKREVKLVFTKCERFKIYLSALVSMYTALDERLKINRWGLCYSLKEGLAYGLNIDLDEHWDIYYPIDPANHMEQYPEIYKHKPANLFDSSEEYWFPLTKPGIRKRIKILEGAINELASSVES